MSKQIFYNKTQVFWDVMLRLGRAVPEVSKAHCAFICQSKNRITTIVATTVFAGTTLHPR
jgi:hypothetical protein